MSYVSCLMSHVFCLLFLYQSNGTLRCPWGIPITVFEQECRFFQLPEMEIEIMIGKHLQTSLGVSRGGFAKTGSSQKVNECGLRLKVFSWFSFLLLFLLASPFFFTSNQSNCLKLINKLTSMLFEHLLMACTLFDCFLIFGWE